MIKIFNSKTKKFLKTLDKPEKELNQFISNNWKNIFPQYIFITNEFKIDGNVRSRGGSGRIDIISFNPKTKKFVIFELKKQQDKNIREQASDYRDFVEDNFAEIYLQTSQKYKIELPQYTEISKESAEIILIAKNFTQADIDKAKKSKNEVTLIKYFWFEDDLVLIEYLNNDPETEELENTEKIKKIKAIIENKDAVKVTEIDMFFHKLEKAKSFYIEFIENLKTFTNIKEQINKLTIKILTDEGISLSISGFTGKGQKKCILRIDTDIENISKTSLKFDDRKMANGKLKGSIGSERFQVYINSTDELNEIINLIKNETDKKK
jgi:hypothetical protein